jgi:hypothetical protein
VSQARGFLSYAHEDGETARRLHAELLEKGHRVWFDKVDFRQDESVDDQILNAIRECRYFILLLTPVSVSKDGYIRKEISLALRMIHEAAPTGGFIIPVRTHECRPLESQIDGHTQFIDLFQGWTEGIDAISKSIPTIDQERLVDQGPQAVQSALCDIQYLESLSRSLESRWSIGVTLENYLRTLRPLDPSVVSRKIQAIRQDIAEFAASMELHYRYKLGELDPATVCHRCGVHGQVVHGTADFGGLTPSDYNDNYLAWCTNCYWSYNDFEIDYLGTGPRKFDYATNTYV